ncbi:MAG TPA: alcohol dehydrogenase catalytic domain-containing protein [Polyangiaceae bacterium]|nr:alcohol dehydrogenase catalytic domain-containing protein [Polyangiaceae bacterium]
MRVLLVGVCRTDVHAADGLLPLGGPRILGHELVGDVVEADEESGWARGDRVVACPLLRCGACAGCASHLRCVEPRMLGVDVDGAFADEVVVPADSLYGVPPSLPLRRAAYVEPIAATLAVSRAPITPGSRGLVLGRGRIADLTTRVLRHLRFTVESPRPDEPPGAFDFVVETAGTQASLDEALHHVRPAGAVVLKSRPPGRVGLDVARAVRNDVRLFAVSYGQWPIAARLASELPIDDLLGDVYAIERFDAAMALTREQPLGPKLFLELGRGG